MPKAAKSKKRRSDEMSDQAMDIENQPPSTNVDAAAAAALNPKALRALTLDLEAAALEVQSRCEGITSQAETDVAAIKQALARQLLRLPPRVRSMSVRDFALLHSLSVSSVALEAAHRHQVQLDNWVQATPRLNKQRAGAAGGSRRELQALLSQPSSLQPYMQLLNTTQRMTRATARKAGLLEKQQHDGQQAQGEEERPLAVLLELRAGHTTDNAHVFQTPSSRLR